MDRSIGDVAEVSARMPVGRHPHPGWAANACVHLVNGDDHFPILVDRCLA